MIVDQETGETEDVQVIEHESTMDTNFSKIWIGHIVQALDLLGNAKIKVISYILENMNYENLLDMTQAEIGEEVGVSRRTVSEVVITLREAGFITTKPGRIYFNPEVVFRGGHAKRMFILHKYEKINDDQEENSEDKEKSDEQSPSQKS